MQITPACAPLLKPRSAPQNEFPHIPKDAWDYVDAREAAAEEPANLKGVVFLQNSDQSMRVLKFSGQTRPDVGAGEPSDIPAEAVRFNRVVISVDGINQEWGEHQRQIYRFLHNGGPPGGAGADVAQPVIGIHQGAGKSNVADIVRIAKDLSLLKGLQARVIPTAWALEKVAVVDPAVKSLHDTVKQALHDGRDVQIVNHSGGGQETALALTLLKKEGFENEIRDKVRVLAMAPACSVRDLEMAGVKSENIYYTASQNDPVWRIFHHHVETNPLKMPLNLLPIYEGIKFLVTMRREHLAVHSPDYIFRNNVQPDGKQRIQEFLTGSPGGTYVLP